MEMHPDTGLQVTLALIGALHRASVVSIEDITTMIRMSGAVSAQSGKTELAASMRAIADALDGAPHPPF